MPELIWVPITTDGTAARIRADDFRRITETQPVIPKFRLGQSHGRPVLRVKINSSQIDPAEMSCGTLAVPDLLLSAPHGFHAECRSKDFRDLTPENWKLVRHR